MNPAVARELARLEAYAATLSDQIQQQRRWSKGRKQELLPHRACILRSDCLAAINTLRTAALFGR